MAGQSDTYWADRQIAEHDRVTNRTIEETNKALAKYYRIAAQNIIKEFEDTYAHILARRADGYETPADLYNLDRYYQMLVQIEQEAKKLGDRSVELMREEFASQWQQIYEDTRLPSEAAYSTISKRNAEAMVMKPWLSDGKGFSERVYGNLAYLLETLEEELVSCVIAGKSSSELKQKLQERFNISYRQAETLVRTETNHIQTEAARQAYQDSGVKKYMYLGREEHDIGCNCKKYDRKIFDMAEAKTGVNLPPLHPNCRCTIKAVVDDELIKEVSMDIEKQKPTGKCEFCGREFIKNSNAQKYCSECAKEKIEYDKPYYERKRRYVRQGYDPELAAEFAATSEWEWAAMKKKEEQNLLEVGYGTFQQLLQDAPTPYKKRKIREWYNNKELYKHSYFCEDCQKWFLKDSTKSNNQKRCPDCKKKKEAAKKRASRAKQ